jgi:acyl carrier protein
MSSDHVRSAQPAHVAKIEQFLSELMPPSAAEVITPQTALLSTGLLDSMSVIQLMVFLSAELGIEIEDDDFTPDNLATVGQLMAFVDRKLASRA